MTTYILGVHHDIDSAAALVSEGKVVAYSEEERHIRFKHAPNIYPARAIGSCLDIAGIQPADVSVLAINWDLPAYANGSIRRFFSDLRQSYDVDPATIRWQETNLSRRSGDHFVNFHRREWQRMFGHVSLPPIHSVPHHYTHAYQAFRQSGFERAVCVTIDGSGDTECTVAWRCDGQKIEPLRVFRMPNSLGWFYSAFTEYLGFEARDGEYKVMGLAAYGRFSSDLSDKVSEVLRIDTSGGYALEPSYIHYGAHSYSGRFTDKLPALFGRPPRSMYDKIQSWHEDLALAVQTRLEKAVCGLVRWALAETGFTRVCIGGGVGMNVKMNSRVFELDGVDDVFAHPCCGDNGAAAGAALAVCEAMTGVAPERLTTLALGHEDSDVAIEAMLRSAKIAYERPADLESEVARSLANGMLVGWFQGRMEAGARALGNRSILADPRSIENRDKVNASVKYREYWRPFCPSILSERMNRYFDRYTDAPFMIISFAANERLKRDAPAIVHVDGTARVQSVKKEVNARYHQLLAKFEAITGVPVLLNTSFNIKGEPIVCTVGDALRTFWSTSLDVLAVGSFMVRKPDRMTS